MRLPCLSLPVSADSTVLVLYLNIARNKSPDGEIFYQVLNYAGQEKPIDIWQVQMLKEKCILRFFAEKERTDATLDFMAAFNEQNLDMLQALLSPDAGIELLEKPGGMVLNAGVYGHISYLFEEYGLLKIGYVRYNDVIYSMIPYLEGFGFFGLGFDNMNKITRIIEYPLKGKHADLIVTDEEIPVSSMRYIPDIAFAEFLPPEATQRFAIKLRFENGETRKFRFLHGCSDEPGEAAQFKSYVFTDEVFADGWLTSQRTLEKGNEGFHSCGRGVEFNNGFSIGKIQLYRESRPFHEPDITNEIVFENGNYRIVKNFEWGGSGLGFDKKANLYKVLLP